MFYSVATSRAGGCFRGQYLAQKPVKLLAYIKYSKFPLNIHCGTRVWYVATQNGLYYYMVKSSRCHQLYLFVCMLRDSFLYKMTYRTFKMKVTQH